MVYKQRAKQGNQNIDNLLCTVAAVKDSPKRKRAYGHSQSLPAAPMEAADYSLGTWQVHSEDLFSRLLVKLRTSSKNHRNCPRGPRLSYSVPLPLDSIFLWPCELPCIMFHSELSGILHARVWGHCQGTDCIHTRIHRTEEQRVDKGKKYQLTSLYPQFSAELRWLEDLPLCGILGSLSVKSRPVTTTHSTLESKSRHPQCFWSTTNFLFPIQGKIDVSLSETASKLDMFKLPRGNDYMDGHFLKTNVPLGYW